MSFSSNGYMHIYSASRIYSATHSKDKFIVPETFLNSYLYLHRLDSKSNIVQSMYTFKWTFSYFSLQTS